MHSIYIPNKTTFTKYYLTQWISKLHGSFKMSNAVPDTFHGFGGNSKHNCSQDRTNFHRSQARQIRVLFNNVTTYNVTHGFFKFSLAIYDFASPFVINEVYF